MDYNNVIRLNRTTSVTSVDKNNFSEIEISQKNVLLPQLPEVDTLNLYDVFLNERSKSNKYRLIFTINNLCSNVLFNVFTEIVKNEGEGDEELIFVDDNKINVENAIGDNNPNRIQMIRNTEYSNIYNGFTYHCGFDIFNNHILRNKTFKTVNFLNPSDKTNIDENQNGNVEYGKIFNTIRDIMRYNDGSVVKYNKRENLDNAPKNLNKHLYEYDNILSISDSINSNLVEENGWFGFKNSMNLVNHKFKQNKQEHTIFGDEMHINSIINTKKPCEFIDMYPDRSLYSFNPKVNRKLKRLEYNWKYCLTYPYKKIYNHRLINNGKTNSVNALFCYSCKRTTGIDGSDILLFRTKCKHGLSASDYISIYVDNVNDSTIKIPDFIQIKDVGNLEKKYKEYYFYVQNNGILENIFGANWDTDDLQEKLDSIQFRIKHVINNFESEYYIRLFKKIPNFKYSKKLLTEKIGKNNESFNEFIKENAMDDNGDMILFDSDLYKLAFSTNIYNDNSSQITFLDTIDISNMVDLNGMPIHEIYLTIIKNNKGYDKWYDGKREGDDVEFSHCFGKITSGFELLTLDDDFLYTSKKEDETFLSDVKKLHNIKTYYEPSSMELENNITVNGSENWYCNSESEKDVFYGDLVEFNPTQVKEVVLENVYHRFNTSQRETDKLNWKWEYDEITSDDYDKNKFTVSEYNIEQYDGCKVNQRPEGYYYRAHYPILLKELSNKINQDSLETIMPSEVIDDEKNFEARIVCNRKHNLKTYNMIQVIDTSNDTFKITSVNRIINEKTFVMSIPNIYSFDKFKNSLLKKELIISKINENIPDYATKLNDGSYRYLWRNVQSVGDVNNVEVEEYPFTNGCFYIHTNINFYLKRQDPKENEKLYFTNFPNDVHGNINNSAEEYEYVNESETIC